MIGMFVPARGSVAAWILFMAWCGEATIGQDARAQPPASTVQATASTSLGPSEMATGLGATATSIYAGGNTTGSEMADASTSAAPYVEADASISTGTALINDSLISQASSTLTYYLTVSGPGPVTLDVYNSILTKSETVNGTGEFSGYVLESTQWSFGGDGPGTSGGGSAYQAFCVESVSSLCGSVGSLPAKSTITVNPGLYVASIEATILANGAIGNPQSKSEASGTIEFGTYYSVDPSTANASAVALEFSPAIVNAPVPSVPEPSTVCLMICGLGLLASLRLKKASSRSQV
jgi:hypothetical protein